MPPVYLPSLPPFFLILLISYHIHTVRVFFPLKVSLLISRRLLNFLPKYHRLLIYQYFYSFIMQVDISITMYNNFFIIFPAHVCCLLSVALIATYFNVFSWQHHTSSCQWLHNKQPKDVVAYYYYLFLLMNLQVGWAILLIWARFTWSHWDLLICGL